MRYPSSVLPLLLLVACTRATPTGPPSIPGTYLPPDPDSLTALPSPSVVVASPTAGVMLGATTVASDPRLLLPFVDDRPSLPAAPLSTASSALPSAGQGLPTAPADLAGGSDTDVYPPPTAGLGPTEVPAPDRAALLAQVQGFARAGGVTGGLAGPDVWVTQLGDRGDGSLRKALETPGPAWVRFAVDGVIRLRKRILVRGDKTVDGRGHRVELQGGGFYLNDVQNVIITHLIVSDGDVDAVSVNRSHLVWLDHLTLARFQDGLIDVTDRSSGVTVSWCRLEDHAKGMLVGAADWISDDNEIRLTVHHSFFSAVTYRHPKLRYGYAHLYNVLMETWSGAAIDVSHGGRLLLEQSQLIPSPRSTLVFGLPVDLRDPPGFARAVGVDAGGLPLADDPRVEAPPYAYVAQPLTQRVMQAVRDGSGWQP